MKLILSDTAMVKIVRIGARTSSLVTSVCLLMKNACIQIGPSPLRRERKLGSIGLFVALLLISSMTIPGVATAEGRSVDGSYFSFKPPGSKLPSDAECAVAVAADTFEPRPQNSVANHSTPDMSFLAGYRAAVMNGESGASNTQLLAVDGQFKGTTDQILKWGACKWGFDEDTVRAIAVSETHWKQDAVGDVGNGTSLGILQAKTRDSPSTCKSVASSQNLAQINNPDCQLHLSTAFAVDYVLALHRACFEGAIDYLKTRVPSPGYPTYPNGTIDEMNWGCVGQWYSGSWYDPAAITYIADVRANLANRPWAKPGF
jgi:hypothetical protein